MKKLLGTCTLAALAVAPGVTGAQSSTSGIGTGPHAYDWVVGTWSCTKSMPSAMGGPANQLAATRSDTTSSLVLHFTGKNYDQYAFLSYEVPSRTWWISSAYSDGDMSNESSTMGGKKTVVFHGSVFDAETGTHHHIRDTVTVSSATKFTDEGADDSSGSMKTAYNSTCTKS